MWDIEVCGNVSFQTRNLPREWQLVRANLLGLWRKK